MIGDHDRRRSARRAFVYAMCIDGLTEIAHAHGYALALHGSMTRDLDIVCVPWAEDVKPAEEMLAEMALQFSWVGGGEEGSGVVQGPTEKPHGRRAWSIVLGSGAYFDVSVTPMAAKERM